METSSALLSQPAAPAGATPKRCRRRTARSALLFLVSICCCAALPGNAAAIGIGADILAGFGRLKKTDDSFYGGNSTTTRLNESRLGVGVIYDTNVSQQQLFNYRLGISYQRMKANTTAENVDLHGVSCDNDFGFRLFSDNDLRLWAGPEVKVEYLEGKSVSAGYRSHTSGLAIGVAPVVGMNLHLDNDVSLSLKGGYMFLEGARIFSEWQERYGFFSIGLVYRIGEHRLQPGAAKP